MTMFLRVPINMVPDFANSLHLITICKFLTGAKRHNVHFKIKKADNTQICMLLNQERKMKMPITKKKKSFYNHGSN